MKGEGDREDGEKGREETNANNNINTSNNNDLSLNYSIFQNSNETNCKYITKKGIQCLKNASYINYINNNVICGLHFALIKKNEEKNNKNTIFLPAEKLDNQKPTQYNDN